MKKEDISISDIERILFGEAPAVFLIEVFGRSLFVYCFFLLVLRLMGKRMSGQLSNLEMTVMLMFGAVVSGAMQIPERGMLQGIFVLTIILLLQHLFTLWTVRVSKVEDLSQGTIDLLVKDGVMQLEALKKVCISHDQLAAILRSRQISSLGSIRRMYMEASGSYSIYKYSDHRPGLSLYPDTELDAAIRDLENHKEGVDSCGVCGYTSNQPSGACPNCGHNSWEKAVI